MKTGKKVLGYKFIALLASLFLCILVLRIYLKDDERTGDGNLHGPILTWHGDPSTTMTFTWIGPKKPKESEFMQVWLKDNESEEWESFTPEEIPFADIEDEVVRFREIRNLQSATTYLFALSNKGPDKTTRILRFRTASNNLTKPITFVAGGDMFHKRKWLDSMNKRAGLLSPDFALLGGDLAYANGVDANKWRQWLDSWAIHAVTPDGLQIPLLAAIGNHEINAGETTWPQKAKFYNSLFVVPRKSQVTWRGVDFGQYLSLVILDSDHGFPVKGTQTEWLNKFLTDRIDRPYVFACYHKPTYGTAKPPSLTVREYWTPLFQQHGVDAVFEHDHHTYKRTHPLSNGKADAGNGVLYLGDGAWGVSTGVILDREEKTYLAKAESRRHLILVTLTKDQATYEAIDAAGVVFDRTVSKP